jgi:excisionase family DNA binding protein
MDVHLFKALDSIIPNEHYDRRLSSMQQEALLFPGHDLPPKKPSGRARADDGRSAVSGAFHLEPLLDTDEAAAIMKIHPKTLQRFARLGRIRGVHVGKLWRFRASEIDAWIDRQIAG